MVRKIALSAFILIIAGLVLVVYSDPQFRLIFGTVGTGGFSAARSFNGTFTRTFNGTFTRTGGGGLATAFGFNPGAIIESLVGVGLIGVGLVLFGIEAFAGSVRPRQLS